MNVYYGPPRIETIQLGNNTGKPGPTVEAFCLSSYAWHPNVNDKAGDELNWTCTHRATGFAASMYISRFKAEMLARMLQADVPELDPSVKGSFDSVRPILEAIKEMADPDGPERDLKMAIAALEEIEFEITELEDRIADYEGDLYDAQERRRELKTRIRDLKAST